MQSLAVIQALKPSQIYPGHGPVVSEPETHIRMYIDNRNNREKQILAALASSTAEHLFTAMDLVKIIYTVRKVVAFCNSFSGSHYMDIDSMSCCVSLCIQLYKVK